MTGLVVVHDEGRREMHAVDIAKEEVRQAKISAGGVNTVGLDFALRGTDVQEVVRTLEILIPELEAVARFQPAQALDDIPGLRNLVLGTPGRGSDTSQSVDFDRG